MREYAAVKPVSVTIDGREYRLLYTFGKVKKIREALKVDLLATNDVGLDVFTKVLFVGLMDPGHLTEEILDDLIAVPQLPYYIERLQAALQGQAQASEETKNDSGAPVPKPTEGAKRKRGRPRKQSSDSGVSQSVNGEFQTPSSGP